MILLQIFPEADIVSLLGLKLWDANDMARLLIRFVFNFLIVGTIVRYIYFPLTQRKDYMFTFLLISIIVFLLCFLLDNVKLQIGFALGLFAIFGILRYRTDTIPIKEMTYLFLVIGLSVINALANKKISISEIVFSNLVVLLITFVIERLWAMKFEMTKTIKYERIELIVPEKNTEMLKDLIARTGLNISRYEINSIDFTNDSAMLTVYYYASDKPSEVSQY